MNGKQALVLGGSGFLGSHVADALSDAGYRARIFDRAASPHLRAGQDMIVGDLPKGATLFTISRASRTSMMPKTARSIPRI